ncbi:hypothetical protein K503DRAFT_794452 [Rhizopogon vinicolor AM-OR11-026]|uniref:CxC1-like cysteine cluster associated with KDZ transposases domain-containing protein n=1 Tax=Rhizopogon vinicolor AM-OR11-026 TaxID=1314800 RepID=A0A1B7MM01_9AGAM|nr:hypothetical protein K503DRAFT_794452 [Rhizopogon vinicolor AM-OR11-026]
MLNSYFCYLQLSQSLKTWPEIVETFCDSSCNSHHLTVMLVTFEGLTHLELLTCSCNTAACQLVSRRFFPCAPIAPTLAVDIRVLQLVKELFVRLAPNVTGWCDAFEALLDGMHYRVCAKEGIHRRFNNAYHWYCILLLFSRRQIEEGLGRKDAKNNEVGWRPSEYLCRRCPLCSRGQDWRLACSCINACFNQKRTHAHNDNPKNPTESFFISECEVQEMEAEVKALRKECSKSSTLSKRKQSSTVETEDGYEDGMCIPTSVLEGCNDSFITADEKREKASTQFFSDTGVMALLCRHDRVLWLVNMTSAGEKQHYTLTLIRRWFKHLLSNFKVGLLYDIRCQLKRSCCKWGFLTNVLPRIVFGISIFHAFGHQWACQIVYHPRKCVGFGLSDGEGCECFWSAIKPLIPSLQVSGYNQRIFVIDEQVRHLDHKSMVAFGQWLWRRWRHCQEKKAVAKKGLEVCDIPVEELREVWRVQVAMQTKPAPKQSKNKGAEAIATILALENILEQHNSMVHELENAILSGSANIVNIDLQLSEYRGKSKNVADNIWKRKWNLSVSDQADLKSLWNNAYLCIRMNARAVKTHLCDRLQSRKFEMKLQNHTEASVKRREPGIIKLLKTYNNLCTQLQALIRQGKAPPKALPPLPIAREGLFQLDIDDEVWQDIGLDDPDGHLPRWLADEGIRQGIKCMLELDHCEEEAVHVMRERCVLQEWMQEEWM